jgi:lysophospholipase L1-like esterase
MEEDVPFLPLLDSLTADSRWLQWLGSDGVHLNGEGHAQVYERVRRWPALMQWACLEPQWLATPAMTH